jgi:hypothetical protein
MPAQAGEAQFGITAEFLDACSKDVSSPAQVEKAFTDLSWVKADPDVGDALKPDDFLKKVKTYKAFEVTIEGGGAWYGASARGKLGNAKVGYCAVTSIDDDLNGYRDDFELASELKGKLVAQNYLEKRYLYEAETSKAFYVMREITSEQVSYFTYIKIYELSEERN